MHTVGGSWSWVRRRIANKFDGTAAVEDIKFKALEIEKVKQVEVATAVHEEERTKKD